MFPLTNNVRMSFKRNSCHIVYCKEHFWAVIYCRPNIAESLRIGANNTAKMNSNEDKTSHTET